MELFLAFPFFLAPPSPSFASPSAVSVVDLRPEWPLHSQHVLYGVPQVFRVLELQPVTTYDIKVSYPATQPSLFSLQVERVLLPLPVAGPANFDVNNVNIAGNIMKIRRRVLNTAKLRLHPHEMETHHSVRCRLEPSGGAMEVEFSLLAEVEGVRRPDSELDPSECVFDIVVEEVLVGAFPRQTLVLIGWLVLLLVVAMKWVRPYLNKKIAGGPSWAGGDQGVVGWLQR